MVCGGRDRNQSRCRFRQSDACPTSCFQILQYLPTVSHNSSGVVICCSTEVLSFSYTATGILTCVRVASRDASRVVTPSPGEPSHVNISLACRPEVASSVASSTSSGHKSFWDPSRKLAQTCSAGRYCWIPKLRWWWKWLSGSQKTRSLCLSYMCCIQDTHAYPSLITFF